MSGAHAGGLSLSRRVVASLLAGGVAALAAVSVAAGLDHRLRIILLDTGGGSATLIRAADGEVALVGSASQPDRLVAAIGRVLPPTSHRLDLLVLPGSSPRLTGGCGGLLNRFTVGSVVVTGAVSTPERTVLESLGQAGTSVAVSGGGPLSWAGVRLALLDVGGSDSGSAAILVSSERFRALLLGDLDPTAQEELTAVAPESLSADLLVAPSRGGVAISLLATARPRLIAVPSAPGQATDHTAWPGADVHRTGVDGDLAYIADPDLHRG